MSRSFDSSRRDTSVDILRGIAITLMVCGHMGVALYHPMGAGVPSRSSTIEKPYLWIEILGGFAPVLFILAAGFAISYSSGFAIGKQLKRSVLLFAAAAALDVLIWRIRPFITMDVLYLFAIGLPIAHFAKHYLSTSVRLVAALTIVLLTPWLQQLLGYSDTPTEIGIYGQIYNLAEPNRLGVIQHWIVDGWFPVFPWLGVLLLGTALGDLRSAGSIASNQRILLLSFIAVFGSLAFGFPTDDRLLVRALNGAMFMPPDLTYLAFSIGGSIILLAIVDRLTKFMSLSYLNAIGNEPLSIYVLHFFAIQASILVFPSRMNLTLLFIVSFIVLAILYVLSRTMRSIFTISYAKFVR